MQYNRILLLLHTRLDKANIPTLSCSSNVTHDLHDMLYIVRLLRLIALVERRQRDKQKIPPIFHDKRLYVQPNILPMDMPDRHPSHGT